jgi:uncharacterized RmlC-like cupin family protein
MRWGDQLEFTAETGLDDFIYVPHQDINDSATEPLQSVQGEGETMGQVTSTWDISVASSRWPH